MQYETLTGLSHGELAELAVRVAGLLTDVVRPGGAPAAIGLFKSVAMVVTLMRKNLTQEVAGAIFGCSQPTVSRRWDLLRPAIGGATVRTEDLAGLRHLAQRAGQRLVAGYVLYTGQQTLPFGDRIRALPIDALWQTNPRSA